MNIEIGNEDISLLQLSDSFFPTGLYATSSGLEALSKTKSLTNKDIIHYISTCLKQVLGPSDCTALGNAHESCIKNDLTALLTVDETLYSMRLVEEPRSASVRSGNQLLKCVSTFVKDRKMLKAYQKAIRAGNANGVYPVSFGVASWSLGIHKNKAGLILLYGFTVSVVGAGLRLGVIQHFDGQQIIHELRPIILKSVLENINRPISDIWQFAPSLDIMQMNHETLDSKMFIT